VECRVKGVIIGKRRLPASGSRAVSSQLGSIETGYAERRSFRCELVSRRKD